MAVLHCGTCSLSLKMKKLWLQAGLFPTSLSLAMVESWLVFGRHFCMDPFLIMWRMLIECTDLDDDFTCWHAPFSMSEDLIASNCEETDRTPEFNFSQVFPSKRKIQKASVLALCICAFCCVISTCSVLYNKCQHCPITLWLLWNKWCALSIFLYHILKAVFYLVPLCWCTQDKNTLL